MIVDVFVAASLPLSLNGSVVIDLADRDILLEHVAEADTPKDIVIARIPRGSSRLELDSTTLGRLVRNRIPGLPFQLKVDGHITFMAPATLPVQGKCFAANQSIAADRPIYLNEVNQVDCQTQAISDAVGYDKHIGAPIATRSIKDGDYLGPVEPVKDALLPANAPAQFVVKVDNIKISQTVETLQSGREGAQVFVRTASGSVLSVPFENLEDRSDR